MISHSRTFINTKEYKSIQNALSKSLLTKGPLNKRFSSQLSEIINLDYVNLTNSGTMAFYKILLALSIKKDDEILVPNYICESIIEPIKLVGAIPVIYDNKPDHWLCSENEVYDKLTDKTKVILINHTFGFANRIISKISQRIASNVEIIEDCCHSLSLGSKIGDYEISKNSLCSFYSFNATKLIATGEGGAIATNDKDFYSKLCKIKLGDNLSDLNCAIGIEQLNNLEFFLNERKKIAKLYIENFSGLTQDIGRLNESIFYRFPIIVKNNSIFFRDNFISYRKGVDGLIQDVIKGERLKNSTQVLNKLVSIPIYPSLTDSELKLIIERTKNLLQSGSKNIN